MAFIECTVSWLVGLGKVLDGCEARSNDTAADTSLLACLHNSSCSVDSRWDQIRLILRHEERRSHVHDVLRALDGIDERCLVQKISLKKRKDSVILGAVIGLCLLFMLWWVFG